MKQRLDDRTAAGNRRQLTVAGSLADFCSNDYLGLARSEALRQRIAARAQAMPLPNGATGSRLISGNSAYALETEVALARLFRAESALLFASGYAANSAVLSVVPQAGDVVFCDQLIHASLREGARLSDAERRYFRHNDLDDLEEQLRGLRGNGFAGEIFVVAESVYSMDGDFGPLADLLGLGDRYDAHLVWDEAHSTGLWGEGGSGLACWLGLHDRIFARIYTFGKAMGGHGACVAGSRVLTDYLVNFARAFIYTTALPPHSLVSIRESFGFLAEHPTLQSEIGRKIRLFRATLAGGTLPGAMSEPEPLSQSPIQILKVGGNEPTKALAHALQRAGFDVRPILAPTVRAGEERLRICLHVHNRDEEIIQLAGLLHEWKSGDSTEQEPEYGSG
ncbi:MAG: pyridoxal phosphate-dependent aminotransferase family protein [Ferruginibacter sp.]|nr:pyridoxal phosphate-dependent aminotransferase family protein [Cytophagales bacterium]